MKKEAKPSTTPAVESDRDTKPDKPTHPKIDAAAHNLKGQLSGMVDGANEDIDAVSLVVLGGSGPDADGAFVVIKGDRPVRAFREWAIATGHLTAGAPTKMRRALEPPESTRDEPASMWLSPPIVCPCSDPDCVERCAEVACKRHPAAGLRCFLFGDRMVLRCVECMRPLLLTPRTSPVSQCAKSAEKSNDSN